MARVRCANHSCRHSESSHSEGITQGMTQSMVCHICDCKQWVPKVQVKKQKQGQKQVKGRGAIRVDKGPLVKVDISAGPDTKVDLNVRKKEAAGGAYCSKCKQTVPGDELAKHARHKLTWEFDDKLSQHSLADVERGPVGKVPVKSMQDWLGVIGPWIKDHKIAIPMVRLAVARKLTKKYDRGVGSFYALQHDVITPKETAKLVANLIKGGYGKSHWMPSTTLKAYFDGEPLARREEKKTESESERKGDSKPYCSQCKRFIAPDEFARHPTHGVMSWKTEKEAKYLAALAAVADSANKSKSKSKSKTKTEPKKVYEMHGLSCGHTLVIEDKNARRVLGVSVTEVGQIARCPVDNEQVRYTAFERVDNKQHLEEVEANMTSAGWFIAPKEWPVIKNPRGCRYCGQPYKDALDLAQHVGVAHPHAGLAEDTRCARKGCHHMLKCHKKDRKDVTRRYKCGQPCECTAFVDPMTQREPDGTILPNNMLDYPTMQARYGKNYGALKMQARADYVAPRVVEAVVKQTAHEEIQDVVADRARMELAEEEIRELQFKEQTKEGDVVVQPMTTTAILPTIVSAPQPQLQPKEKEWKRLKEAEEADWDENTPEVISFRMDYSPNRNPDGHFETDDGALVGVYTTWYFSHPQKVVFKVYKVGKVGNIIAAGAAPLDKTDDEKDQRIKQLEGQLDEQYNEGKTLQKEVRAKDVEIGRLKDDKAELTVRCKGLEDINLQNSRTLEAQKKEHQEVLTKVDPAMAKIAQTDASVAARLSYAVKQALDNEEKHRWLPLIEEMKDQHEIKVLDIKLAADMNMHGGSALHIDGSELARLKRTVYENYDWVGIRRSNTGQRALEITTP